MTVWFYEKKIMKIIIFWRKFDLSTLFDCNTIAAENDDAKRIRIQ